MHWGSQQSSFGHRQTSFSIWAYYLYGRQENLLIQIYLYFPQNMGDFRPDCSGVRLLLKIPKDLGGNITSCLLIPQSEFPQGHSSIYRQRSLWGGHWHQRLRIQWMCGCCLEVTSFIFLSVVPFQPCRCCSTLRIIHDGNWTLSKSLSSMSSTWYAW